MIENTQLDAAYLAAEASPEDDTKRLAFFERLAASELFLLLESEADGDKVSPQTFEMHDETFVLVFDLETRLTELAQGPAPYAALSGRALAAMLAPQNLGLALNIDVAPSSSFVLAEEVVWLNDMLSHAPQEIEQKIEKLYQPKGLPEKLLTALDARLAAAAGLARSAYLVGVGYEGGGQGHLIGFIDVLPGAEAALAQAVSEVLSFSGLEAAALDVAFFAASDAITARLAKEGLRFDLPKAEPTHAPEAPGMNPEKPPKLK